MITHFLYEFASGGDGYYAKGRELEEAIASVGKKAEGMVDGIAKNPRNLLIIVRTDFSRERPDSMYPPVPGTVRAHSSLLNHARDVMGDKAVMLPPEAGDLASENWEKIFARELKRFAFSKDVKISYTGEMPGWCPKTAAVRAVRTLHRLFGIKVPKARMEQIPALSLSKKAYNDRFFRERVKKWRRKRSAQKHTQGLSHTTPKKP